MFPKVNGGCSLRIGSGGALTQRVSSEEVEQEQTNIILPPVANPLRIVSVP